MLLAPGKQRIHWTKERIQADGVSISVSQHRGGDADVHVQYTVQRARVSRQTVYPSLYPNTVGGIQMFIYSIQRARVSRQTVYLSLFPNTVEGGIFRCSYIVYRGPAYPGRRCIHLCIPTPWGGGGGGYRCSYTVQYRVSHSYLCTLHTIIRKTK